MGYRRYQSDAVNPMWVLILINFLMYIATLISSGAASNLLALQPASVSARPWTVVTSMFVHAGFFHLFFNMLALYFFGTNVRRLVGDGKFALIYFGGGILGSILVILLAPLFSITVGASGAVFALGGTLAIMRPKLPVMIFPIPAPIPLWIAVIGFLLIGFFLRGVSWQAHLGGVIFGLAAGYLFRRKERRFRY